MAQIFRNPDKRKTVKFQLRIEEDLASDVAQVAQRKGTTTSAIVRNLLRGYLAKVEREAANE